MQKGIAEINVSDSDELRLKKINENFKNLVTGKTPVGAVSTVGGMYSNFTGSVGNSLSTSSGFASSLSAYMIDAQYITAQKIGVNDLLVDYAQVNFANIGSAAINNLFANKIATEFLDSAKISVHTALEAVKITADCIDANTITADKIRILMPGGTTYADVGAFISNSVSLWKLLNQSMYSSNQDFADRISELAAEQGVPESDIIRALDNGIDGKSIAAHTITATELHVTDLYATHAKIGGLIVNDPDGDGGITTADGLFELRPTGYFRVGAPNAYIEIDPHAESVNVNASTLRTQEDIVIQNSWKWDMTAQGALNLVYIGATT